MSGEYCDQFRHHETAADRERQRVQFEHAAAFFGMTYEIFQYAYSRQDAAFFLNDKYVARVEAKYRFHYKGFHPTYTIDVDKLEALVTRARRDGVHELLLVSWNGDEYYLSRFAGEYKDWPITIQKHSTRKEYPDPVRNVPLHRFFPVRWQEALPAD